MIYSIQSKNQNIEDMLNGKIMNSDIPGLQYNGMDSKNIIFEYAKGWADIKKNSYEI